MKKEEAQKEIDQLRYKRQNAMDDARIRYLEGFIDGVEYAEQEKRENNKKHRYCPYCGEPLTRDKHKIWCNDVKEQEEQQ